MLTLKDINEVSFTKTNFAGYKPEEVDEFIDDVIDSFKKLLSDRDKAVKRAAEMQARAADSQKKLSILAEKVENYRQDEDGIKDAILSAQRVANESIRDAKEKASLMLSDAKEESEKMVSSAKEESEKTLSKSKEESEEIVRNAKIKASKLAEEYIEITEEKRVELEEMKRQVSTFKTSLLEMYKKHLELIDRIPNFKNKQSKPDNKEKPVVKNSQNEEKVAKNSESEKHNGSEDVAMEDEEKTANSAVSSSEDVPEELNEKIDFSDMQNTEYDEEYHPVSEEQDLSSAGIDTSMLGDIPETLKNERRSKFSNLEFGDGIDVTNQG